MATKRKSKTKPIERTPSVKDVFDLVQSYADRWKAKRTVNGSSGPAWKATERDGAALEEVVFGILDVLAGLSPWTDVRLMHAALVHADRGERERRQNVVRALGHAIVVWRATAKHPDRRKELVANLLDDLKVEHLRFGGLSAREVTAELSALRGKAGAVYLAGRLSARCHAFGDHNAEDPAGNFQQAIAAMRKK